MRASTSQSLTWLCSLFDRNRQSYYEQGYRAAQAHQQSQEVEAMVVKKRQQMPRLGTRKLYYRLKADLEEKQLKIGRDRLFAMLPAKSLLVGKVRKYTQTSNSRHWMHKYENLIEHLLLERAEQLFVSDITYLATQEGFTYLSLVTDAYSKQIMGYALRKDLSNSGTMAALQMALANRH
jgi:transposase InsO family protein